MGKLQIEYVPLDSIKPYKNNAKLHPDEQVEQICNSIRETGFNDPIGVWNDEIVEGHGRLLAAEKLGMKNVPIIRLDDLTDEQRRAYMLAHNKLTMNSGFDVELLDTELAEIETIDMTLLGFDDKEEETPQEVVEDDFEGELPEEPKSKYGDIYQCGDHRVMCGDATIQTDLERLMGGAVADLYLTDPPYNVDYEGGTEEKLKIMNDKQEDEEFCQFLTKAFSCANTALKEGGVFYIWHADSEGYNFRKACKETGWKVRECLIWNKNSLVLGRQDYQWKHEPCLYGWKEGAHIWNGDRKQTTVLDFDKPKKNDLHPTMKPIALFSYEIQNSSNENEVVLDSFGGSGTTLICCEQLNRKAYLMELDPRYVDVIIERWEKYTGKKAVKLNAD